MGTRNTITRRQFMKAAGAAGPYVITSAALGAGGRPAPSNRVVMGCIGIGGMGTGNLKSFLHSSDVHMAAVCDVDSKRREAARKSVDGHYAKRGKKGAYKGCAAYNDLRELIAREDIDAVAISTPDHWHVLPAIAAAKAGKDVYVEKPLTLTIAEGRALSDTVLRYGRVCQVGSQQRSEWRFRFACELVRNGRIGKLHTIRTGLPKGRTIRPQKPQPVPEGFDYDMWLGQAPWEPYTPKRCHYNFRFIRDYSGGQVTNWGSHHNDIAQWGNGAERAGPVEIEGKGEFPRDGLYNVVLGFQFTCTYANGVKLICTTKSGGVRFEGSDGWVYVNRGRIDAHPKSLLTSVIRPNEIHLYESRSHKRNFLDCVKTRAETVAPAEIGHRSASVCHLGNIAMLLGRKVKWNPECERFVNDPEADRMISRPMRAPWRL